MHPAILDLIQRMKTAATLQEREKLSVDLETAVRMACDPEMTWGAPTFIRQGECVYRAYPITPAP